MSAALAEGVYSPTRTKSPPQIDGRLSDAVWGEALSVTDLTVIEPNNGKRPEQTTRFQLAYDDRSLFIGIACEQSPQTFVRRISARDKVDRMTTAPQRDAVRIVLDPSGTGRYAYLFEVALGGSITDGTVQPEREFSYNWDGPWRAATSSNDGHWYAEMAIPWDMMALPRAEGRRIIGFYLQRDVAHLGEYWSLPPIPRFATVFLSSLAQMEVHDVNPGGRLTFYPYLSVGYNGVEQKRRENIGTDLFWQPSSDLLVSLTINPDFGQVENDEVVVNFSAEETHFQEKRPFFVEGNEIFEPEGLHILHTRRIGGGPDPPELNPGESIPRRPVISDIIAAVKVTGQRSNLRYGFMSAVEDDSYYTIDGVREETVGGRQFHVIRGLYETETAAGGSAALGYLGTLTRHASHDAQVHSIDGRWQTGDNRYRLESQFATSDVRGRKGYAWNGKFVYSPDPDTKYEIDLDYTDDQFDIDDLGHLDRNDRLKFKLKSSHYRFDIPRFKRFGWGLRSSGSVNERLLETKIGSSLYITLDNLTRAYAELYYIPPAWDDTRSYGNGDYRTKEGFLAYLSWSSDSSKPVRLYLNPRVYTEDNGGITKRFRCHLDFDISPTWQLELKLDYYDREDWILWQEENRLNGFDADQLGFTLDSNLQITHRQELRLGLQWVGIDAVGRTAYRIGPDGHLLESGEDAEARSFDYAELSGQIRYKFEFAPLSDLFLVYTRGSLVAWGAGSKRENFGELLRDSFEDRDVEVFLVKLRYRY